MTACCGHPNAGGCAGSSGGSAGIWVLGRAVGRLPFGLARAAELSGLTGCAVCAGAADDTLTGDDDTRVDEDCRAVRTAWCSP
jgi:hypothetical protein